jgi:hypothetical protein
VRAILASGFHTDIVTVVGQKPVRQSLQISLKRRKTADLVRSLVSFIGSGDTRHKKALVDIYAAAYRTNNINYS